jgi:hypothetical protein
MKRKKLDQLKAQKNNRKRSHLISHPLSNKTWQTPWTPRSLRKYSNPWKSNKYKKRTQIPRR